MRRHLRILRRTITLREIIRRAWGTTEDRGETAEIAEDEDGGDAGGGVVAATATAALTGTAAGGICRPRSMLRPRVSVIRAGTTGEVVIAARVRLLRKAAKMTFCYRANRSRSTAGVSRSHRSSQWPTGSRKSDSRISSSQLRGLPLACSLAPGCHVVFRATYRIGFWRTTRPRARRLG